MTIPEVSSGMHVPLLSFRETIGAKDATEDESRPWKELNDNEKKA